MPGQVAQHLDRRPSSGAHEPGHRTRLPGPDLQRDEGDAARLPDEPPYDVEPVGAAVERAARLVGELRREPIPRRDVWRGWVDPVPQALCPRRQVTPPGLRLPT